MKIFRLNALVVGGPPWRHTKSKMVDGRHYENRKYAITRPCIVWSSPNFARRRRYRHKFEFFFHKNCENMKIWKSKMADGCRFENRQYAITRPRIIRSPNFARRHNMASRGFVTVSWASCPICLSYFVSQQHLYSSCVYILHVTVFCASL